MTLYRPLVQAGAARPAEALPLAGGPLWFTHAERRARGALPELVEVRHVPEDVLGRLTLARPPILGLEMDRPHLMGILNVTPDSFSDGGRYAAPDAALEAASRMTAAGVSIIDVGGESTRPGAATVPDEEEIARTAPVISALRDRVGTAVSIDTRKSAVARAALEAGADIVNDVSGFTHDPELAGLCAERSVPVCVMHAQGDPETMQENPAYEDVVAEVWEFLQRRIDALEAKGIPRGRIIADPGIGFGKTLDHNLEILRNISVFHGLGCPVLLGASRKRFIGTIAGEPRADARAPGSMAVGLAALAQGVQILRVHDVAETAQAVRLWQAVR